MQMHLKRKYMLHMSLGSVHRYMSILNIKSKRKRKFVPQKNETCNLCHTFPNVIKQNFHVSNSQKWLTDITYLPCKDGMLYLSCIKDLSDKSIIAYSISNKNDLRLVLDTLTKAIYKLKGDTILHSDQGRLYYSTVYRSALKKHGITGSMSRKATPYDNAPMESFFSTLKNEELCLYSYITGKEMRTIVRHFIKYYNYERPQWNLKKMTPIEFRSHLT